MGRFWDCRNGPGALCCWMEFLVGEALASLMRRLIDIIRSDVPVLEKSDTRSLYCQIIWEFREHVPQKSKNSYRCWERLS